VELLVYDFVKLQEFVVAFFLRFAEPGSERSEALLLGLDWALLCPINYESINQAFCLLLEQNPLSILASRSLVELVA